MLFKQLFHGHDTNVEENIQTSIYHNRTFPLDENYNFIILNEKFEDFDLYNLIVTESETATAPLRFITTKTNNRDLFESLNFDIETYRIFENRKLKETKASSLVSVIELQDLPAYQAYRNSYTDPLIEAKLFKAKKNKIIVALLDGIIFGSMILHERKDFIEVDDLFVLEDHRSQGIGSALLNYAKAQGLPLRLITDQTQDYLKHGFKELEVLIVATRY